MRDVLEYRLLVARIPPAVVFVLCSVLALSSAVADLRPESRLANQQERSDDLSRRGLAPQDGLEANGQLERIPPVPLHAHLRATRPRVEPSSVEAPRAEPVPAATSSTAPLGTYGSPGLPVRDLRPGSRNFLPLPEQATHGRHLPSQQHHAPEQFRGQPQFGPSSPTQSRAVLASNQRAIDQPQRDTGWLPGETGRSLLLEADASTEQSVWSSLAFWQDPGTLYDPTRERNSDDPNSARDLESAEEIGERPQDNSRQFLRSNTVLLRPGQLQVDYGLIYTLAENEFPVPVLDAGGAVAGAVRGRVRSRLLTVPLQARYGLNERAQMFLEVPLGWGGAELSFSGFDDFSNKVGIGDVRLGTSVLLKRACSADDTDLVGTFAMTFPTGNASLPLLGLSPNSQLGEGFFALSLSLLWIKTIDPLVLFYGGGYRHRFDDSFLNVQVDPGEQFTYQFGVGFAVNERITLSTAFLGAYVSEFQVDGDRIEGSILEPARLRFSATISQTSRFQHWRGETCLPTILEPFAEIGMTNDAPSVRVGVVWTL